MDIKAGSIISSNYWQEPVKVISVRSMGSFLNIKGTTRFSGTTVDDLIPIDELDKMEIIDTNTSFSADAQEVFLALECLRYRYASMYDPLLAMNTAKIHPLPHQIEAVYSHVLKKPRIRFLIADDPGAGKTIMAGLIIKELKLRRIIKRTLIVAPGHLKDQWRRELKDRFEERFIVVDRNHMNARYGENVWESDSQIITSIDFAKREDIVSSLNASSFDLVIVDEAHKMSATRYGDKLEKTNRYKLGEILSKNTEHLLFLTATPHRGDPENFRLFLDLLEPGYFSSKELLSESIQNKDNPLFLRRVKEDLKDFEGKPLFLPRHVSTVSFRLDDDGDEEKELYNDLSKYVKSQYKMAMTKNKNRNIAFALVILQRRFASSTYALYRSLERRKNRIEEILRTNTLTSVQNNFRIDFEGLDDLSEEERWEKENILENLSASENRQEWKAELQTLSGLINRAEKIINNESEIKLKRLKESLIELSKKFTDLKDQKILIFTESRDTLEYLQKKLETWGYSVNTIHGGMKLEERIKAESVFKNETQIMIATEAAGEGINLQFCHMMINYDIPWNPNRLEQRMGRIHRYGQTKEVYVFNMVAEDTREGQVLKRLFEKMEEIRQALGNDKVFDVLSEIFYGKDFPQLLTEAASNSRSQDEIIKDIECFVDPDRNDELKEALGESLASRFIDYTRIKEMAQRAREHKLIPEYTQIFFQKAFEKAGGKIRSKGDFYSIERVPMELRLSDGLNNKKLLKAYPKATFDNEIAFKNPDASFITFGHPLFEVMLEWVEKNYSMSPFEGATFVDPDSRLDGYVFLFEGEIKDGNESVVGKRLFACYSDKKEIIPVSPEMIWDLKEENIKCESEDIEKLKEKITIQVIDQLTKYRQKLQEDRERQADIKEKYGVRSLESLIFKLDGDLIDLEARKIRGEDVQLPIHNKEEKKKRYELNLKNLVEQIKKEKTLAMAAPKFAGVIRVLPKEKHGVMMVRDPKIEKVGMDCSMEYERKNDREPEDVSKENEGFDIRSKLKDGTCRYIEVKARAGIGAVELTNNEWLNAKKFKEDYYLYVVLNSASNPELHIIQDPVNNLEAEKVESVRYLISSDQIKDYRLDD